MASSATIAWSDRGTLRRRLPFVVLSAPRVFARPFGGRLRVSPDGVVRLTATFRRMDRRGAARPITLRFEPVDGGVRIVIPARHGERWEYSAFFVGRPRRHGRVLADRRQRIVASVPTHVALEPGYASADHAHLVRARLTLLAPRTAAIAITVAEARR
jgi:hypothetical protein